MSQFFVVVVVFYKISQRGVTLIMVSITDIGNSGVVFSKIVPGYACIPTRIVCKQLT